jgi:regulator of protease activity HflC (stomatin/prohibitin superfamily)
MSRHDTLIVKDTHRGLLYEDGVFREVLPAGRYRIPRPPSKLATFFGKTAPLVEVVLIDVRGRDRTIVIQELLTADSVTISANFVVQFRVDDPRAAVHQVKNFEERLYSETQTAARRVLRGLSLEEVIGGRDEIGEEIQRQVEESAGSYGLAVTGLDLKDLIVPAELRKVMNRAVLAKRLRQFQMAEGRHDDEAESADEEALASAAGTTSEPPSPDSEDEPDLILAKAEFARDRRDAIHPEGFSIRRSPEEKRGNGFYANGFDLPLQRCRS